MRVLLFLAFCAFAARPIEAKPVGKASFLATGEGLALDIKGEGGIVDGDVKQSSTKISGVFTVKLKDFKTGIAMRDEHMLKALEVDKYPTAKFTLVEQEPRSGNITGTLELHGKSLPYFGQAEFKGSQVSVTGKIKLSDFGIKPPEYKLAKVSDEVSITVDLAL